MDDIERQRMYWVWADMRRRCYSESHHAYQNYGGRGITVCARWADSFDTFIKDVGPRPSRLHSIDRVCNDGPYAPENCKWATRSEQNMNKRDYKNNSSGYRNIIWEEAVVRGYRYCRWRVRVRRGGKIVTHKRFENLADAIQHRDFVERKHA